MRSGLTFRRSAAATLILLGLVLALVGSGCSGPTHKPTEFIGTWHKGDAQTGEVMLALLPDGTGTSKIDWYPHDQEVRWVLVGDKLVISAMDGSGTTRYDYRFDGPGKLVLKVGQSDLPLAKGK